MGIANLAQHSWYSGLLVTMLVTACAAPTPPDISAIKISENEWRTVANLRILFGHQSVGDNMLDGVRQLAEQAQVKLPIMKNRSISGPGITHFYIGHNGNPDSKISDFSSAVQETASSGQQPDIAMMKLCYIDINRNTDIKILADNYIGTMVKLRQQFPNIKFVAITVPLTTLQAGPKAWVKRLMGKDPSGYLENVRREEFNQILRERFNPEGLLFDLAAIEAQGNTFIFQGRQTKALPPALTSDEGHLNELGQQIVAATWVQYLAK